MRPLLLPLLLLASAVPAATAESPDGCDNYGLRIDVGSSGSCGGASTCANAGIHVLVGSDYTCTDGSCRNHGVLVAVGSDHCGTTEPQACLGDSCVDLFAGVAESLPKPGATARERHAGALPGEPDCPRTSQGWGSRHIECGTDGVPCGVMTDTVCWTVRYACMNGGDVALRLVNKVRGGDPSTCDGQPGWQGNFSGGPDSAEGEGDLPAASLGVPPSQAHGGTGNGTGCRVTVGNCTGGSCRLNLAGNCRGECSYANVAAHCAPGGACTVNAAATCRGDCQVNVVSSCAGPCDYAVLSSCAPEDMCTVKAAGQCVWVDTQRPAGGTPQETSPAPTSGPVPLYAAAPSG